MIQTITTYSIVIIPILIFLITTGMKLYVGKSIHEVTYGQTFLELPVDLIFISVALAITFISKSQKNLEPGIVILLGLLLISILSTAIWKYSSSNLTDEKFVKCGILGFLNYNLTIWPLVYIINLIVVK